MSVDRDSLVEALKQLGRGRIDAAEEIADAIVGESVQSGADAFPQKSVLGKDIGSDPEVKAMKAEPEKDAKAAADAKAKAKAK